MQNKSKLLLVLYPLFPTPKESESVERKTASSGKPRDAGGGEKRGQHVVGPR